MSDNPLEPATLAGIDQMNAGAVELARTLSRQWEIYRGAGMPKGTASELVYLYFHAVTADVCPDPDDE